MRTVKFSLVIICLLTYIIVGWMARVALVWTKPHTVTKILNHLTYYLMRLFKRIGGLKITVLGEKDILKEKGLFIISPHVGYIDAIILGTLLPGSFTTKKEVKNIPLLGKVVTIGDSIFINRGKKSNIIHYVNIMADRLRHKINVFNFPEGHATNGTKILSFFPSFFNAPLETKSPIVPITIDYKKIDGNPNFNRDDIYCYDGNVSTLKHLWNLLKFKNIDVTVTVHEKIQPNGHPVNSQSRKFISHLCMSRLSSYKNLPISRKHPLRRSPVLQSIQ